MKRIDEFEEALDTLLEQFSDVDCEDLADSFEYYASSMRAKERQRG